MPTFVTFTTGDREQPDTIFVNRARVIYVSDGKDGGSVLHCNDSETLNVFESPKDAVAALSSDNN